MHIVAQVLFAQCVFCFIQQKVIAGNHCHCTCRFIAADFADDFRYALDYPVFFARFIIQQKDLRRIRFGMRVDGLPELLRIFHDKLTGGVSDAVIETIKKKAHEVSVYPESDGTELKKELSKIRGLLQVISTKLSNKKYQTDHAVTLQKLSTYYIDTYDFTREIEILAQIYYKDSSRLKNLRLLIINSLNDKRLIEKFQTILNEL